MVQEVKSDHEELRERDKVAPEVKPETEKPRRRSLKLWASFGVSFINCLPPLFLKFYFSESQF